MLSRPSSRRLLRSPSPVIGEATTGKKYSPRLETHELVSVATSPTFGLRFENSAYLNGK